MRFLSNKRGYAATFGRELMDAGFDPREVMDKTEIEAVVLPTLTSLLARAFPLTLDGRTDLGARRTWMVADSEAERQEIEDVFDLLVWQRPPALELS